VPVVKTWTRLLAVAEAIVGIVLAVALDSRIVILVTMVVIVATIVGPRAYLLHRRAAEGTK
jgi:hypothetical protein